MNKIFNLLFTFLNRRLLFNKISPSVVQLLKSRIIIFDIGASGKPQTELLSLAAASEVIICEPDKRIQEETKFAFSSAGFQAVHFIEKFLGDGSESLFHLTKRQECSSLLKPNIKILSHFPLAERFENESVIKINTSTINSLNLNNAIDFLKIDTQGSELEILKNFDQIQNLLLIESEVEFLELYTAQPLQRNIDEFLSSLDFNIIDLQLAKWKLNTSTNDRSGSLARYCGRNMLSFANAIYINNLYLPWNLSKETAKKENVIKIVLLLSRFKQISLSMAIIERSFDLGIINNEEFKILKNECVNFKLKKLLFFLLPKKLISTFEFDREFI